MRLFVRVSPAAKAETFRRCGMTFTRDGAEVDVDEATANRLMAEQMLEVQEVGNHSEEALEKVPAPAPAKASKTKAKA